MPNIDPSIHKEIFKAAPPVAVTAWRYLLDLPVEKWVSVATLIYVLLQGYFLLRNELRKRDKK